MTLLTLCMIVRNEERMLADCLSSVRSAVDEIVVVDTGSTDGTVAIAEAAGATVVHREWDDDFAGARNAALERAKGRYVLLLDADERIAPGRAKALRKLVKRGRFDVGRLPLFNANRIDATASEVIDGSARDSEPILLPRVFRRTSDLRWEGRVHEHVTTWARAQQRFQQDIEVPIVHYGAIPELRERLGKNERNQSLLRRICAEEPDNLSYATYLGQEYLLAGDLDASREVIDGAWSKLKEQRDAGLPTPDVATLITLKSYLALLANDLDRAAETLDHSAKWSSEHPNFGLLRCVHAERTLLASQDVPAHSELVKAALAAGRDSLRMKGRLFGTYVLPGSMSWATTTRLGTLHLLLNEPAEALREFDAALVAKPGHAEALLGRGEALALVGQGSETLAMGETLIATGESDAWVIIAIATLQLGTREDVAAMLESARKAMESKPLMASHRGWFLEELWNQVELMKTPA